MPTIQYSTPKVVLSAEAMASTCVILPMPKEANTAKIANNIPRKRPKPLCLNPFCMTYIGPPAISPREFFSRYLTASMHSAYFVVKPKRAEIHIQTRAPGPPNTIAVATPAMLPVPIVADNAVIRDWNGVISPSPPVVCLRPLNTCFSAKPRFFQGRNLRRKVRKIPVPTRRIIIAGPHTKSFTLETRSENPCINTSIYFFSLKI